MKPFLALLLACASLTAQSGTPAKRVVIIKVDGLPQDVVTRALASRSLPWIERVFVQGGTVADNFYVRGISLSAPSWSMLDTGMHTGIRGNAEFDRTYARVYDYLNFFPFYIEYARLRRADMPAVEWLDQGGVPLLIDQFAPDNRYQSMQLFQRGVRWKTLQASLKIRFARPLRELISEWQTGGLEFGAGISAQQERELRAALSDSKTEYLDLFVGDFDHTAHLTNDQESQLGVLRRLDALVGRVWTAIEGSPWSHQTLLVMVSDHGMNSAPQVYSQSYDLVQFLNSKEGGGHHVITTRHPLTEYKLRGLDPLVSWVTSPSGEAAYLRGQEDYPTALLDPDGNERASLQLRNSDWNALQILMGRDDASVLDVVSRHRESWTRDVPRLREELQSLRSAIQNQKNSLAALAKSAKGSLAERRSLSSLEAWERDEQGYFSYLTTIEKLLAWKIGDPPITIPKGVMGDANSVDDLRNYVVGLSGNALQRMDYLRALTGLRVRNVVQKELGASPVDFVVARETDNQVLVYKSEEQQARLSWREEGGRLMLQYVPVNGEWRAGLPLALFEDPELCVDGDRGQWLSGWHSEQEWMRSIYRTRYSNGVIGLAEHFRRWTTSSVPEAFRIAPERDWPVLARFAERKRRNVEADLLILANNHWNFNARGFNPGGNHGSFFQTSTHSVLMFAGAGVAAGTHIQAPEDSLSFVPTVLKLMGRTTAGYPGKLIAEMFPATNEK